MIISTPLPCPHGVTKTTFPAFLIPKPGDRSYRLLSLESWLGLPCIWSSGDTVLVKHKLQGFFEAYRSTDRRESFVPVTAATNLATDPATSLCTGWCAEAFLGPGTPRTKVRTYGGQEDEAMLACHIVSPASFGTLL